EMTVTAPGTNDDCRAGGFACGRLVKLNARNVFGIIALCARRGSRPEGNWCRLTRSLGGRLIRILDGRGAEDAERNEEQRWICHHNFNHSASLFMFDDFDPSERIWGKP